MRGVDGQGHEGRRRGDRRHDAHRTHGKSAVQSGQPDDTRDAGRCSRQKLGNSRKGVSGDDHPERDTREADRLREDEDGQDADSPRRKPPGESPVPQESAAPSASSDATQRYESPTGRVAAWASS